MTQAGFLSADTGYILNREKLKQQSYILNFPKKKLKSRSDFLDKCLILHSLFKIKEVKIMFGADTKALHAKYCLDI